MARWLSSPHHAPLSLSLSHTLRPLPPAPHQSLCPFSTNLSAPPPPLSHLFAPPPISFSTHLSAPPPFSPLSHLFASPPHLFFYSSLPPPPPPRNLCAPFSLVNKEIWCLTSTETIRLITGGEKGKWGTEVGERERVYTYRYTVTTRMTAALRWAAMREVSMLH